MLNRLTFNIKINRFIKLSSSHSCPDGKKSHKTPMVEWEMHKTVRPMLMRISSACSVPIIDAIVIPVLQIKIIRKYKNGFIL